MSIALRPMRADEFDGYLDYFIPDYAAEISSNYGVPLDEAQAGALQEINDDLAQGVDTSGHELLCIVEESDVLGYIGTSRTNRRGRSLYMTFAFFRPIKAKGMASVP